MRNVPLIYNLKNKNAGFKHDNHYQPRDDERQVRFNSQETPLNATTQTWFTRIIVFFYVFRR